jgi:hypothetical protein
VRLHRHRWVQHPRFRSIGVTRDGDPVVRVCAHRRCGRVETCAFAFGRFGAAGDHMQPKLRGWFRLPPFGLFLEVPHAHREV